MYENSLKIYILGDCLNLDEINIGTGKSLREELILAPTNPQYENRSFRINMVSFRTPIPQKRRC